jgi:transcription elongation factor GreA
LETLFRHIESEELFDVACRCLAAAWPDDWPERLLTLLPLFPLAACDLAARRLVETGRTSDDFDVVVEQILAAPAACFEALLWLWDGPTIEVRIANAQPVTILTRVLRTLEEARLSDDVPREIHQTMCARARAVLSARKHERFIKCLDGLEPSMARALRRQIARGEGLGLRVRDDLVREIDRRAPPRDSAGEPEPWERDDILYVTQRGLAKKREEINHHVNVKMAENARAIGRAAERGDLSENSEYKFALEERDLLRARLAQMNKEVAQAHVITPDEVPVDHIGVGTKAMFRRLSDGEQYDMTFAGPWEAAAEKGWFNYKAPLPQSLMGKRVGDVVEFDHSGVVGRYQIVSLHNALAD